MLFQVYCHVSGAYPEPEVSMWSGDRDITHLFEKTSNLRADGDKGLRALTYDVSLKNDSLVINYEYSKKKLECRAQIPDTDLPQVTKSILVNLSGCKYTQLGYYMCYFDSAFWQHRSRSTLAQVMTWCLAPSHYLNQCWLIIQGVHSVAFTWEQFQKEVLMNLICNLCLEFTFLMSRGVGC